MDDMAIQPNNTTGGWWIIDDVEYYLGRDPDE